MMGGVLASEQSQEGKLDAMPEEGKECKTEGRCCICQNYRFSQIQMFFLSPLWYRDLK